MENDGLWCAKFVDQIYQFNYGNSPVCNFWLKLLYVAKTGHLLFCKDMYYLMVYNPKDETIKLIGDDRRIWFERIVYIESLVSPNVID